MKRVLLSTIAWAVCLMASVSAPVSEQVAKVVARNFIHQNLPAMSRGESLDISRAYTDIADDKDVGFYVFNASNGYVIVGGDDKFLDILAYGYGSSYDDKSAPAAMKALLKAYHFAIKSQTFTRADVPTHSDVSPFIITKWNQLEPYNKFCPATLKEGICPTGCVATAMAQVMYYYQYPDTYEWSKMKTTYRTTDTGEAVDAVAKLMADCGAACFMNYSVDGSGTSDIYACEALRYDFGYAETTEFVDRECYTTLSWDALIYNEISAKRPVMYGALSASSGQGVSGHEFILDGYEVKNGNGYYHVNWGWGGASDDYFMLSVLNPNYQYTGGNAGSSGYSFSQSAIIGITPADSPMQKTTRAYVQDVFIKDDLGKYDRSSTSADFPPISINFSIYNIAKPETARDYDCAIALFKDCELIRIIDQGPLKKIINDPLDFGYGVNLKSDSIVIDKDLADGKYQVRILSRESETTDWAWAMGAVCRYIELVINGTTMETATYGKESETDECDFTINNVEWSESPRVGKAMTITINLTNKNKTSNSPIFLWGNASVNMGEDNYQLLTGGGTNLDPGETGDITLEYTPQRGGSFTFILSGSRKNCNVPLYTFNEEVSALSIADVEMDVEIIVEGSEEQLDGTNRVSGKVLTGTVKLTNRGANIYDDEVTVVLYESSDGKSFNLLQRQKFPLLIDIKMTENVTFYFDDLTIDKYYAVIVYAIERGEYKALNLINNKISNKCVFCMTGDGTTINDATIDEKEMIVYNINGIKISNYCDLKTLPQGFYIINHRKVFNRK